MTLNAFLVWDPSTKEASPGPSRWSETRCSPIRWVVGMVSYADALRNNREQVFTLPDATIIYSGHGPLTMVGEQKHANPFFADYPPQILMKETISFVGVGRMGTNMARRLKDKGYSVTAVCADRLHLLARCLAFAHRPLGRMCGWNSRHARRFQTQANEISSGTRPCESGAQDQAGGFQGMALV